MPGRSNPLPTIASDSGGLSEGYHELPPRKRLNLRVVEIEVEGCGNEEPQPLVVLCVMRPAVPFRRRLRLREWKRRTSAFSSPVYDTARGAIAEKVEAEGV